MDVAGKRSRHLFFSGGETVRGELRVELAATHPIEEIKAAVEHAGREARGGKILVLANGSAEQLLATLVDLELPAPLPNGSGGSTGPTCARPQSAVEPGAKTTAAITVR